MMHYYYNFHNQWQFTVIAMFSTDSSLKRGTQRLRGFTQYEVLMVLAVMATLTTVAMPIYTNLTGSSKLRVLSYNLHNMNRMFREAYRSGVAASSNLSSLHAVESETSVESICTAFGIKDGLFVDSDGNGSLSADEIGFRMDIPPGSDPYEFLVGQHLHDDYSVKVESHLPLQLAIYNGTTIHELP
jgi:type II secretory pathway pseudopilin PulG